MRALKGSDRIAVITPAGQWTGHELWQRAAAAADWLDEIGAPPGEPVPALVASGFGAVALLVAGAHSRRPLAAVGPRQASRELTACLARYHSPVVVADADYVEAAATAAHPWQRVEAIPDFGLSSRSLDDDPGPDEIVVIMHTSGTTGVPKSVPVPQWRLAARVRNSVPITKVGPDSVYCTMSPFQHIAGVGNVLITLARNGTIVLSPPFTIEAWEWLGTLGTTHALLVPTMIDRLLEDGRLDIGTLQVLSYGAAPIHPDTLDAMQRAMPGVGLCNVYGMTEGSPITALTIDDHREALAGKRHILQSVGRAAPGVELKVVGPDDGGVGEVHYRADHVYLPADDGWVHTGDLGRLDDEGYLYLVGRAGDRIIRGGENVEALEVEDVLATHPMVREAGVVGVPDRRWGEVVKAYVVPAHPGRDPLPEDLRAFARERLAGFKVPTLWEFRDELPRNETGKLLRRRLREG